MIFLKFSNGWAAAHGDAVDAERGVPFAPILLASAMSTSIFAVYFFDARAA
jgi:hypothetical protein